MVAAATWLGGLVMLAVTTVSALRTLDREAFRRLLRRLGWAFAALSALTWLVLGVSGLLMAAPRLGSLGALSTTGFGRILALKTGFALLTLVATGGHVVAGRSQSKAILGLSRMFAVVAFATTLAVFYCATLLT